MTIIKKKTDRLTMLAYHAAEACFDVYYSTPDKLEEGRRVRDKAVRQLMFYLGKDYDLKPSDFCPENDPADFEYALLHHLKTEYGDLNMAAIRAMQIFVR